MDRAGRRDLHQHLPRIPANMAHKESQHHNLHPYPEPMGLEMGRQISQCGEGVSHVRSVGTAMGASDKFLVRSMATQGPDSACVG
jgi:hypothetical protein|tara:strand:- start:62 stop:316 length:255 start_codon:yes stop_codon:yes gene_type:complete